MNSFVDWFSTRSASDEEAGFIGRFSSLGGEKEVPRGGDYVQELLLEN